MKCSYVYVLYNYQPADMNLRVSNSLLTFLQPSIWTNRYGFDYKCNFLGAQG